MLNCKTTIIKNDITCRTNRIIENILNSSKFEDLNEQEIERIAKLVVVDKLKTELNEEIEKTTTKQNLDTYINKWLNKFESNHTKKSYKKNLQNFLNWLGEKSIQDVDALIVDDYISYLKTVTTESNYSLNMKKRISVSTQRQRIMAVSSFWKSLLRWNVVPNNPWHGANLPAQRTDVINSKKIPTDYELDEIEKLALREMTAIYPGNKGITKKKNNAARYAYAVLKILRSTGIRIGALPTLSIDRNGVYNARSKGSKVHGKLKDDVIQALELVGLNKNQPFNDYKPGSFTMWLWRASGNKYFAHSLRHRFSITWWNEPENGKDIVQLKNLLFHKSVRSTEVYLSTLKYELTD